MLRNQLIRNNSRKLFTGATTSKFFHYTNNKPSSGTTITSKLTAFSTLVLLGGATTLLYHTSRQTFEAQQSTSQFYNLSAINAQTGQIVKMSDMKGKVCLIVNVASNCGFTPQYKGLQELYDKYGKDGKFEVIAFPSNTFNQEKGSTDEICTFTKDRFKVTFKIMEKVEVNGNNAHPIYQFLKQEGPGGFLGSSTIKWNFTKFLISKEGKVIGRYAPTTDPLSIAKDIEKAINNN